MLAFVSLILVDKRIPTETLCDLSRVIIITMNDFNIKQYNYLHATTKRTILDHLKIFVPQ